MNDTVNRFSGRSSGKDLEGRDVNAETEEVVTELSLPPSVGNWVPTAFFDEIGVQLTNYPELLALHKEVFLVPGQLMTATGIDILISNMRRNTDIQIEATQFLDVVNIIEMMNFGVRPYTTVELFTIAVLKNRGGIGNREEEVKSSPGVIRGKGKAPIKNSSDLEGILENNPIIIGIYMYLLVADMTNILETLE